MRGIAMANELAQGAPAGAAPAAAPAGAAPAAPAQAEGGDPEGTLEGMVSSVDTGIGQLAQLLAQADPSLGEAMTQVGAQFRSIIERIAGGGAEQAPAAEAPVPAQAGAGETVPAF